MVQLQNQKTLKTSHTQNSTKTQSVQWRASEHLTLIELILKTNALQIQRKTVVLNERGKKLTNTHIYTHPMHCLAGEPFPHTGYGKQTGTVSFTGSKTRFMC